MPCEADEPGALQTTLRQLMVQGRGGQIKLGGVDRITIIEQLMVAGARALRRSFARMALVPFSTEANDANCLAYHAAVQLP